MVKNQDLDFTKAIRNKDQTINKQKYNMFHNSNRPKVHLESSSKI